MSNRMLTCFTRAIELFLVLYICLQFSRFIYLIQKRATFSTAYFSNGDCTCEIISSGQLALSKTSK